MRIRKSEDIPVHPMKGAIFETFVFSEIYKAFAHSGELPPLYFWRDRTGHEVDIVVDIREKTLLYAPGFYAPE